VQKPEQISKEEQDDMDYQMNIEVQEDTKEKKDDSKRNSKKTS
jgi:hypothetical protein